MMNIKVKPGCQKCFVSSSTIRSTSPSAISYVQVLALRNQSVFCWIFKNWKMKNVFWLIFKQANLLVGDFWKVWKGGGERVINLVLSENPGSLASFQTLTFNALSLHFLNLFRWYYFCPTNILSRTWIFYRCKSLCANKKIQCFLWLLEAWLDFLLLYILSCCAMEIVQYLLVGFVLKSECMQNYFCLSSRRYWLWGVCATCYQKTSITTIIIEGLTIHPNTNSWFVQWTCSSL